MVNRIAKGLLCAPALIAFLFSQVCAAQTRTTQGNNRTSPIACYARPEHDEWTPAKPAIVEVTVESLLDSPLEIPLWSGLSLAPASPRDPFVTHVPGKITAAVSPGAINPSEMPSSIVIRDIKGDGTIRLRFLHKGDKANLTFDAADLTWDYEVVNRTPTFSLFSLATPGKYSLQFKMTWANGSCKAPEVPITITKETRN